MGSHSLGYDKRQGLNPDPWHGAALMSWSLHCHIRRQVSWGCPWLFLGFMLPSTLLRGPWLLEILLGLLHAKLWAATLWATAWPSFLNALHENSLEAPHVSQTVQHRRWYRAQAHAEHEPSLFSFLALQGPPILMKCNPGSQTPTTAGWTKYPQ